ELVSLGHTGLLEAADRFDPGAGTAFATFASYRIRGAMYDGMRKMGHVPRGEYRKIVAARQASEYLENLQRRAAGARERAGAGPSTTDTARELYEAMRSVATVFVTSLAAHEEAGHGLAGTFPDPGDALARKRLRAALEQAIAALPDKERHFIEKCYFEGKTMMEAGQELGLSRSWSSRLHARAVELLRDLLAQAGHDSA